MSIEVENLSFAFRTSRSPVLRDLTAGAEAGRVTAVLGPNGAGKSTLLRVILGELQGSGSVTLKSADRLAANVHRMSPTQRSRGIAYIPQRGSEAFGMTVRSVVELGAWAGGQPAAAATRAMTDTSVNEFADRPLRTLSAGQQQRVLLARALAQLGVQAGGEDDLAGKVLLADEPASAMDLRWVDDALARLRSVAQAGATVVVVLHDLTLTERFADDVWLLADGELVASGPTAEVLTDQRVGEVWALPMKAVVVDERRVWISGAADG